MTEKYLLKLIVAFGIYVLMAGNAYAANLSVQIEQPKSPTSQDSFEVNFVSLDILNRDVTVKCFKKGPADSSFTQFGTDINLTAGGDTESCAVSSSILSAEGTYNFYVTATDGLESVDSSTVVVDFHNGTPGTPGNYSKDKVSSCDFKIKFKTADDGGKTSKVVIYRSDQTSFTADSSTEVGTVSIGSNQDGEYTNSVPDCNKTYYFALRAFSVSGNGSGTAGDSFTTVVTSTTTTKTITTSTQGAIPVASPAVGEESLSGQVLEASAFGSVLGEKVSESSVEDKVVKEASAGGVLTEKNIAWAAIILGILLLVFFREEIYQKLQKRR